MSACNRDGNEDMDDNSTQEENQGEADHMDDLGIDVKLLDKEDNLYAYVIEINGDRSIQTGMPYTIEKLNEDEEWEAIDLDLIFTMQLVHVDKNNPFTQDIDVSPLDDGTYRISKSLLDEDGDVIEDVGTIEFEISD